MRRGWLIVVTFIAILIPLAQTGGQESDREQQPFRAKKVSSAPIPGIESEQDSPRLDLVEAFEAGRFDAPDEAEVEELVAFLLKLSVIRGDLSQDQLKIQTRLTRAQGEAAERILASSTGISDRDFYFAAKLGLSGRISQIPGSPIDEQRRTLGLVSRQLRIGAREGLQIDEIRNVTRSANYMERHGDPELALRFCAESAELIRAANAPRYQKTVSLLELAQRRLSLLGQRLELSGTTLKGTPFQWSDYRDKVVLVDFWATWSLPSVAELALLKRQYETYRQADFEIVGVILDSNRDAAEKLIAEERIPWQNLFRDESNAIHPMAMKYGIRSVPTGLLVDQEGNVVSIRARGLELDVLLSRLLGPESFLVRDLASQGLWSEASRELQRLIVRDPEDLSYWVGLGALQLLGNDRAGYEKTCRESWMQFIENNPAPPIQIIPLFCLALDRSLSHDFWNPDRLDRLSHLAQASRDSARAGLIKLMCDLRLGRYEACLETGVIAEDAYSLALSRLIHAVAARRLGKDDQAAAWIDQARSIIVLRFNDPVNAPTVKLTRGHWVDCVVANCLLVQAEAEIDSDLATRD